jgi:two-component system NtrC family sensor kinase
MNDPRRPLPARILLVEDSQTQALLLQHRLEQEGFAVDWARSAEAALERLEQTLPDLLITDLNLPGVKGDELCRRMRMGLNTRGIPILLITSENASAVESRALESGADDFVNKSEDADILLLRIQALLRKSDVQAVLAGPAKGFAPVRLLIVEDSPTYRQLLATTLGREGYHIREAESGDQALALAALEPFDAVMLDLVLPDMSGGEVCRRMTEMRRTLDNDFFIMALTGQEERQDMGELLEAGADDVVGKSRDMAVIKARLRALVRRKHLYDENRRILEDFRQRERALLEERAERQLAEARAALVGQLEAANRELKDTQAQLVQSAKMASLGQLVAGIAHEINNPIAFVTAHLQTVQRIVDEVGEPGAEASDAPKLAKARQRLKDMAGGLERVRLLVLKLRTFSRLDEGEWKPASVRENVEAVIAMLQHKAAGRIEFETTFGEPDVIECFPGLLNQALMNVISNAIDAIEGNGRIAVRSGGADGQYEISVSDSGKGIAAAHRERIFEPFFTTKPVGQGTGLGMSITYQIVRRHGGSIDVRSGEGGGTTITFRLPAAPPLEKRINAERQEQGNGKE